MKDFAIDVTLWLCITAMLTVLAVSVIGLMTGEEPSEVIGRIIYGLIS